MRGGRSNVNLKVLVVDDDPLVRRSVKRGLTLRGYRVEEAMDGWDGMSAILNQGPFDVVLSDLEMPELDGVGFLRGLSRLQDPHAARFVFHTTNPERVRGQAAPAVLC